MNALLDSLRHLIPVTLRRRLRQFRGISPSALHPDWRILSPVGPRSDRHVVLDVGAHVGWFTLCWKEWCPTAEVHAFEPYAPSFAQLQANTAALGDVRLNRVAVSDARGEFDLNVLGDSIISNSLLMPDLDTWRSIDYRTGPIRTERVPVITLDDYAQDARLERVHLLKIDVQGLELSVLRGAERLLERTEHVLVESGIRPLYQGAARFSQVHEWLTDRGFHLMSMRAWHRGNRVLVEADMLFRRNGLEPVIDARVDRIYEYS